MKNIFYYLSMFTLFLTGVFVFVVAYWLLYPYKTIQVNTNILPTNKSEYRAGEILIYHLDYCKCINKPVSIARAYIDGVIYSMPDVSANTPFGCHKTFITVEVPNLPSGEYKMKVTYTYKVNPIREIETTVYTNSFRIIEGE
jgi:hypothetical protein